MKKILTLIFILTLVFSLATVNVFASDEEKEIDTGNAYQTLSELENPDDEGSENIFAGALLYLNKNADKLFSALAFIASLILAFIYKKGLVPTVKSAVEALAEKISELQEAAGASKLNSAVIETRLKETEEFLIRLAGNLEIIYSALEATLKIGSKSEELKEVILNEIDMLYGILMSSALPEQQKEAVKKRVLSMKETLKNYESNMDPEGEEESAQSE